jgi:hypothetical protein
MLVLDEQMLAFASARAITMPHLVSTVMQREAPLFGKPADS